MLHPAPASLWVYGGVMEGCYLSRLQSAEDTSYGSSTCFPAALPLAICSLGPNDLSSDREDCNAEHIALFSLNYQT